MNILVFKAGTWKGTKYENDDLKKSVDAYNSANITAPWTVGHNINPGDPAAGWIRKLEYREDNGVGTIIANSEFNALGAQLLSDETHENKSISFFPPGHDYNPVPGSYFVRHVAMLGAELPALSGLGPIAPCDFSTGVAENELLTYNCPTCTDNELSPELSMLLEATVAKLAEQVAALTKILMDDNDEDKVSAEDTPAPEGDVLDAGAGCAACEKPASFSTEGTETPETPAAQALDYKALYDEAQKQLRLANQANASVATAQAVEEYFSNGVLDESQIKPQDLSICLTKLSLGHTDFSATDSPEVVIRALLGALQVAKPSIQIPLGEETESFSGADTSVDFAADEGELGDLFYAQVNTVAATHALSFSQAMSAVLSAKATAAETKLSYVDALSASVNQLKLT